MQLVMQQQQVVLVELGVMELMVEIHLLQLLVRQE